VVLGGPCSCLIENSILWPQISSMGSPLNRHSHGLSMGSWKLPGAKTKASKLFHSYYGYILTWIAFN